MSLDTSQHPMGPNYYHCAHVFAFLAALIICLLTKAKKSTYMFDQTLLFKVLNMGLTNVIVGLQQSFTMNAVFSLLYSTYADIYRTLYKA